MLADDLVGRDFPARGRRDLEEEQMVAALAMFFQEAAITQEPFFQPLGIIEPVDADDRPPSRRVLAQPFERFSCGRAFHRLADLLVVDSARIVRGLDRAIATLDHPFLVEPPTPPPNTTQR